MPGKIHKDKLINHHDRIESARKDLFSDLESLTDELDHLVTAEKLSVKYIKRKTRTPENVERSGFRSKIRIFALKLALILPFKYKAPKISDSTGKNPEYKKLKSGWEEIRQDLREEIKSLDESMLEGEILKHPIVGMLNMKQTLKFFDIHFHHHRKQVYDLMKHPEFPGKE